MAAFDQNAWAMISARCKKRLILEPPQNPSDRFIGILEKRDELEEARPMDILQISKITGRVNSFTPDPKKHIENVGRENS